MQTTQSSEIIEEVLESFETGSSFMSARQAYDTAIVLQPTITLDAVNARIKQIYNYAEDPAAYAIFITAPPGWGQGVGEDDVRRIIEESGIGVDSYVQTETLPEFLSSDVEQGCGESGEMQERVEDSELGVTLMKLQNGVRLGLKRTDYEIGQASITVLAPGGRSFQSAPGAEGSAELYMALLALGESGLGEHSATVVGRYCALHEIEYTCVCEYERCAFELSWSTGRWVASLHLAYEFELH